MCFNKCIRFTCCLRSQKVYFVNLDLCLLDVVSEQSYVLCYLQVTVNGVDYQPQTASPNKKHAKAMAATVALQALGEVTHSSDSHVTFNISHPASV